MKEGTKNNDFEFDEQKFKHIKDEIKKLNFPDVSDDFDQRFNVYLEKIKTKKTFLQKLRGFVKKGFSNPKRRLLTISISTAAVLVIILIADLVKIRDYKTNSPKVIVNESDTSNSQKENLTDVEERDNNLLTETYKPENFEDNPILMGYISGMRSNGADTLIAPKQGSNFISEKLNQKINVLFDSKITIDPNVKSEALFLKVYLGSNISEIVNKEIFRHELKQITKVLFELRTEIKLYVPGKYFWKLHTKSELLLVGSFYINKK